ncbi:MULTISPECIES: LysR family transcriptional regulator [unclassified Pseudomonas]|uniref:LysR family transcriptional regulator n=1 Tax=unclassified Pseudomonas TaxID=196821 RepID=UPI000E70EA3D|nr:LysR family transcriptional regulator [Pseudomonas sp. LS-2]NBB11053.1 LysR family transcriptional regulator [Pseudomonas sp. SLFW]RJX79011.1 LysR family transcriptional regulator [Pseudomonas sp. LS-2]
MKLTLRQLDIFRAIAQLGSTTQASAALALSQSATSAALHELEGALDIQLFDRVGKRLVLNENGQTLLPKAIRLIEAALEIEGGFRTDVVARLRVGCSTTIGNYIMPLLMQHMAERAGGTQIDVILGNSAEITRQAAQLSIDVGLVEGPSHQPTLAVQPWCEDELIIVAAADDPLAHKGQLSASELREARWLVREEGSGTAEEVQQWLLPHLGSLSNARQIGSSEAIKRMVAAGIGISCLSYWVVGDLIAEGRLISLNHVIPEHKRQLHAVYHRDKFISLSLEAFFRVIKDFASANAR